MQMFLILKQQKLTTGMQEKLKRQKAGIQLNMHLLLIRMLSCHPQGHAGSKTLLQQNTPNSQLVVLTNTG